MAVMPTLFSFWVIFSGAAMTAPTSATGISPMPMAERASSLTPPLGSPAASTATSLRSSAKSLARVALLKPTTTPLALRADARAMLLKAPWWPSLPISWIGRSLAARSSAARRLGCAASGWLPLEKFHCSTLIRWPGAMW